MNLDTKAEKAWHFLVDEMRKQTQKLPGEFTIKEFMEETGRGEDAVRKFLEDRVKTGQLSKRRARLDNGALTNLYKVKEN